MFSAEHARPLRRRCEGRIGFGGRIPPRPSVREASEKRGKEPGIVTIRLFGLLRFFIKERGLPACLEATVPPEGRPGLEIAEELGLPADKIEAVFRNGVIQRLDERIYPGDRVAFVPPGTPGPYRVLLGMVGEK